MVSVCIDVVYIFHGIDDISFKANGDHPWRLIYPSVLEEVQALFCLPG